MPRENKTHKDPQKNRSHDERRQVSNVDAPSFSDYGDLLKNATIGEEGSLKYAQNMNALSALPIIGPFVQAYDANRYLEDYYKNTGMVPRYPAINTPYNGPARAISAATNAVGSLSKIAPGTNDLYQFYSGEPDNFRAIMNGMYM